MNLTPTGLVRQRWAQLTCVGGRKPPTPLGVAAGRSERDDAPGAAKDLRRAVRTEWTKLRTVPSTGWLLIAVAVSLIAVSALTTAPVNTARCPSPAECDEDTVKLSLSGVQAAQAVVVVLAALAVTNEYTTKLAHTTLAATPRRRTVLLAKAIVVTGATLVTSTTGVLGSVLAGRLILPGHGFTTANGYPPLSLGDGPTLRAAAGTVLYLGLVALFTLGVATAVRDTAAAIVGMLGVIYAFPLIGMLVTDPRWSDRLARYGPTQAGLSIQATMRLDRLAISPWAGMGVLAAYAGGAMLLGGVLFARRDA